MGELIEQWIDTHERLQNEQLTLGGAHLVFTDPYPQWRRETEALIAQGQKLLDAPDPAQLAETACLESIRRATKTLKRAIREDRRYHQSHQALAAKLQSTVQGGEEHALVVQLSGPPKGMWEDKAAKLRGDLLDLIRIAAKHNDITQAMAAARAFIEVGYPDFARVDRSQPTTALTPSNARNPSILCGWADE